MVEWGAKTIPEGGCYALPERRHGDGVMIVGDAAGFVEVPSLKGIHYAMQSGMYRGARPRSMRSRRATPRRAALAGYDRMVNESYIAQDLQRTPQHAARVQGAASTWAASRPG